MTIVEGEINPRGKKRGLKPLATESFSPHLKGLFMTTQLSKPSKLTHADLAGFTGTTRYYRYSPLFRSFVLTDGTKYLAEAGECYWLFDQIASLQFLPVIRNHPELRVMQFWYLEVREDRSAVLRCEWDKNKTVYMDVIPYTDFPLEHIRIWVGQTSLDDAGQVRVAFLPSEY